MVRVQLWSGRIPLGKKKTRNTVTEGRRTPQRRKRKVSIAVLCCTAGRFIPRVQQKMQLLYWYMRFSRAKKFASRTAGFIRSSCQNHQEVYQMSFSRSLSRLFKILCIYDTNIIGRKMPTGEKTLPAGRSAAVTYRYSTYTQ